MAISITRAKTKESNAIEKVKRGPIPSPNSETTVRSSKESTKPCTRSSSNDYKAKTWERRMPSYVKPKTSSRSESQSQSVKQLKSNVPTQKPSVNRKPVSASISYKPKAEEVPSLRPHKALVSLGPPHKTPSLLRTSSTSTPSPPKTTISHKPISKTTSKTPRAANPRPLTSKTSTNPKNTAPAPKKKVTRAPVNSTKTRESSDITVETSRLETVPLVTKQKSGALKVEDDGHQEVEKVPEIAPRVQSTEQHDCEHQQQQKVELDQPQIQADDERAIPSAPKGEPASVTKVEEEKGEPKEEKAKDDHGDEESTSQEESNNWKHQKEQPATDGDVEVKDEVKEEGGVIENGESENNYEAKSENNYEAKTLKEREGEETRSSEDKADGDEPVPKGEEVKTESTPPKEEANVIEETASKLLETRENKVKALAGAFQSVIDHQTSSK